MFSQDEIEFCCLPEEGMFNISWARFSKYVLNFRSWFTRLHVGFFKSSVLYLFSTKEGSIKLPRHLRRLRRCSKSLAWDIVSGPGWFCLKLLSRLQTPSAPAASSACPFAWRRSRAWRRRGSTWWSPTCAGSWSGPWTAGGSSHHQPHPQHRTYPQPRIWNAKFKESLAR